MGLGLLPDPDHPEGNARQDNRVLFIFSDEGCIGTVDVINMGGIYRYVLSKVGIGDRDRIIVSTNHVPIVVGVRISTILAPSKSSCMLQTKDSSIGKE